MKAFTIFMMIALANMVFSDFDHHSELRAGAVFKLIANENQRNLDAVACEQSETDAIADVACLCVGGTENCDAGKYCYDDTCNDNPKPVAACTPSDDDSANINDGSCDCDADSTTNECEAGKFCYDNVCTDFAKGTMGSNCPCLSFDELPAEVQTEISCPAASGNCTSVHPDFPAKYGSSCVAWENIGTWYDACHPTNSSDTPDYCANSWCYVNNTACSEDNSQSSYFNETNGFSENIFYSYDTCGHGNSWTTTTAEPTTAPTVSAPVTVACVESGTDAITEVCLCGTEDAAEECNPDKYCYDDTCNDAEQ